ncbi:MAG: sugar ABC transporter ATP-binding protein [Alphaproteobacteria bacterium]|jgi:ABC-type polysaccharide/polyol phosphate transport system ATPase subunit|nr:sugar ABC transporter ATP-binding protein [Alphaproteobacteria bacterium]PPR13653.1 MAG: Teichoic acids export ATP-binding protein TagH [Alphaproteobacteria bacterium MarineAlpha12_Bin1]|tara:strand:+ start:5415 stop:6161 length:747 start_codon:yes stop_codon:yes gene_type:complete
MASIHLRNVDVDFPLYSGASRSLKTSLLHLGSGGRIGRTVSDRMCVQALTKVSLQLKDGDRLGIIGPNGSGKTTLLRVLSSIYEPSAGQVFIEGSVASLFDVALGMDTEGTGYENITLRGMLLGLSRSEIEKKVHDIAEFTELGDYLSIPVRTYSSGMLLRLAFAVCTSVEPEILLMDEWIGVGDARFLEKARVRLDDFVHGSSILALASHSNDLIRQVCNKAVLMDKGSVSAFGEVKEIIEYYEQNY